LERQFANASQFAAAGKVQSELKQYLDHTRTNMDGLFCQAADAGGAVQVFRPLYEQMQERTGRREFPPQPQVAKPLGAAWGLAQEKMGLGQKKAPLLDKAKMLDMAARLSKVPKSKKAPAKAQENQGPSFDERMKTRLKEIRKGGEKVKGRDHLTGATWGKCNCPNLRCSHNPTFIPGNRPMTAAASADGLFTLRQRASGGTVAGAGGGGATRGLGGTQAMGGTTRAL
jgi:hypothetical protein